VSAVAGNAVGKNYSFKSLFIRQIKSLPRIKWANDKQRRRKHYVEYVEVGIGGIFLSQQIIVSGGALRVIS